MSANLPVILRAPDDTETVRDIGQILNTGSPRHIFIERAEQKIELSISFQRLLSKAFEMLIRDSSIEEEVKAAQCIKEFLDKNSSQVTFIKHGKKLEIPETVYEPLCQVLNAMASNQMFYLVPHDSQLTTQQAAELLNVSRPYLVKLLDEKTIPSIKVGSHRRVRIEDLINYKNQRDTNRESALSELAELHQSEGGYE